MASHSWRLILLKLMEICGFPPRFRQSRIHRSRGLQGSHHLYRPESSNDIIYQQSSKVCRLIDLKAVQKVRQFLFSILQIYDLLLV